MGEQVKILEHKPEAGMHFLQLLPFGYTFLPSGSTQATFSPMYQISPAVSIVSSIVAQRSIVDLPDPEGPMIDSTSPFVYLEGNIPDHLQNPPKLLLRI